MYQDRQKPGRSWQYKELVWIHGEIKTPPFSRAARFEIGGLLRRLQRGELLTLPRSRPMPIIGHGCHELRIADENTEWRIVYRTDFDAILIIAVFAKKTLVTPRRVIEACRSRLKAYDSF